MPLLPPVSGGEIFPGGVSPGVAVGVGVGVLIGGGAVDLRLP